MIKLLFKRHGDIEAVGTEKDISELLYNGEVMGFFDFEPRDSECREYDVSLTDYGRKMFDAMKIVAESEDGNNV